MAHISSLQSGIFTYLDIYSGADAGTSSTVAAFAAKFVGSTPGTADPEHIRIPSVREFPSVGTPANIVNVPVYGQPISAQVQAQADAPNLEVTINLIPSEAEALYNLKDKTVDFRLMLAGGKVSQDEGADSTISVENTEFYWTGKIEAILINPSLSDSSTATVTLSTQTDFFGPATIS